MIPLQRSGEHKEAPIHREPPELSLHTESIMYERGGHHHKRQIIQLTCNMTTMRVISHRIILIREEIQLLCRYSTSFAPQCHSSSSSKKSGHPSCENYTAEGWGALENRTHWKEICPDPFLLIPVSYLENNFNIIKYEAYHHGYIR